MRLDGFEDGGETRRRPIELERYIGSACGENPEYRLDRFQALRQAEGHARAGPDAAVPPEPAGKAQHGVAQLPEGDLAAARGEGHALAPGRRQAEQPADD